MRGERSDRCCGSWSEAAYNCVLAGSLWSQIRNQVKASHCGLRNPRIGFSDTRRNSVRAADTKVRLVSPRRRRRGLGCGSGPLPVNSRTSLRNSCLIRLSGLGGEIGCCNCRNCSLFLPSLDSGGPISGATGSMRISGTGDDTAQSCLLWSAPSSASERSNIVDLMMPFTMPGAVASRNSAARLPRRGLMFFFLPPED